MKYRKNNKLRRIELVGHVIGMSDDRTAKKPDGRRKAEGPKLRWLDCIANDLESMGVKIWRNKAEERLTWAVILMETVVKLYGTYANEKDEKRRNVCILLHSFAI